MERPSAAQLRAVLDEVALLAPVTSMAALRTQAPAQLMRLVRAERAGWVTMNRDTGVMSGYHVPEMLPHISPLMIGSLIISDQTGMSAGSVRMPSASSRTTATPAPRASSTTAFTEARMRRRMLRTLPPPPVE